MRAASPLAGIKVVDLTRLLPGPWATTRLAQWGAEVVKVEGPEASGQHDSARDLYISAEARRQGQSGPLFHALAQGKRLLCLDLQTQAGMDALHAELLDAHVLVEGFRPGVMARLGLSPQALAERYPSLVVCAITGYGQQGPWAMKAGHDLNYIAMSGVLSLLQTSRFDGALPDFQIGDVLGGTMGAVEAILAAVIAAQRTGQGSYLDISMTHETARHAVLARAAMMASGRPPSLGTGLLTGGAPCYSVYAAKDGRHIAVAALELKFWRSFCQAIDRPQWGDRHWTMGEAPGSVQAQETRDALKAHLLTQTRAHWLDRLAAVDCCVTPVLQLDEVDAHLLFTQASPGVD